MAKQAECRSKQNHCAGLCFVQHTLSSLLTSAASRLISAEQGAEPVPRSEQVMVTKPAVHGFCQG